MRIPSLSPAGHGRHIEATSPGAGVRPEGACSAIDPPGAARARADAPAGPSRGFPSRASGAARTVIRRAELFLLLAAACALAACRHRQAPAPPRKPVLGSIRVDDVTPTSDAPIPLDRPWLEQGIRDRLLASDLFAAGGADGGAGPVANVRVAVGVEAVEVGPKGEARAHVRLRLDTRPAEAPGALTFDLEGQGVVPYAVPPRAGRREAGEEGAGAAPLVGRVALRVAGDLVDGFVARRRLHTGPPAAVHAALMADGGELRQEAIRVVGERGLREEVPTLLKLLSDPDEPTRDAALGALIALKDRRAVTELTRTRSLRDRREMRKIIEAIAILGGQEADEYLSFVAATHDDDEIRAAAAAARARLNRKQPAPPSASP